MHQLLAAELVRVEFYDGLERKKRIFVSFSWGTLVVGWDGSSTGSPVVSYLPKGKQRQKADIIFGMNVREWDNNLGE